MLWWQGPTLLNPHFAVGTKDQDGSRIFYEPLAGWDADGNLVPVLAAEIPTLENGGLAEDGKSVTWKLKQGVKWHDGKPFTADDCRVQLGIRRRPGDRRDDHRQLQGRQGREGRRLHRPRAISRSRRRSGPTPSSASRGMIIPKHLFAAYKGAKSREAPANLKPVGTGPYKFVDFKPGDMVRGEINPNYHMANRPYFDTIEMKGGGDAVSAARAVLQTGEYDFAWNMQVEDEILQAPGEAGGKGRVEIIAGRQHRAHPAQHHRSLDRGRRRARRASRPSIRCSPTRRCARRWSCWSTANRCRRYIYGRTGIATANFVNNPERFVSKNTKWEFNVDKANQLLDEAGWKRGADGIREKDGKKLKFVYQTSINAPRQKTPGDRQAGLPEGRHRHRDQVGHGVGVLLLRRRQPRHLPASSMRHADVHDDDDAARSRGVHAPVPVVGGRGEGEQVAGPQHHPLAERRVRQAAFKAAQSELDPVKRAALFIAMNDLVVSDPVVIPVVYRPARGGDGKEAARCR